MKSDHLPEARALVRSYSSMEIFRSPTVQEPIQIEWLVFRIANSFVDGGTLVDLGGGFNITNAVLVKLGMKVYCVDLMEEYFLHSTLKHSMAEQFEFLKGEGVNFISADLLDIDLLEQFGAGSVDAVCSYHCLEHFHQSPRRLLSSATKILKSNGFLFVEVPNAANILKRLKLLLGKTNYLPYSSYYESDRYLGHVREYTVGDLKQLAKYLSLRDWKVFGTNYYGNLWNKFGINPVSKTIDRLLTMNPGLCGALHLKGYKPES